MSLKRFPCKQCGAQLAFEPGTESLKCEYCSFLNEIPKSEEDIVELDFHKYLTIASKDAVVDDKQTVKCSACAAEFTLGGISTADTCPFCGSHVILPVANEARILPKSLLPFQIPKDGARESFKTWISKLWLAPNELKKFARDHGGLEGMYLPYWTYDSKTTTWYSGLRGDAYYTTETYTDSDGNQRTRQERHINWTPASGTVWNEFDDLLVVGSQSVPNKHAQALKTWNLSALKPYQDDYLSGFRSERYKVGLEEGFEVAKSMMQPVIENSIRIDIGGDEQQISSCKTQHDNVTFKHILLPIWLGSYKYREKSYTFLVNGQTGEISGDAPISIWKVLLIVICVLAIVGLVVFLGRNK